VERKRGEADRNRAREESGPGRPAGAAPDRPTQLGGRSLTKALRRSASEFRRDNLTVWAAALTYYGVLSIFPGLLVLVGVVGLFSDDLIQQIVDTVLPLVPGAARDIVTGAVENVQQSGGKAGTAAVIGLLVGFWSASGYVGGFMQASNAIYDVPEGRPIWKKLPVRLGITLAVGVLMVLSILIVVVSGRLAEQLGELLNMSAATVTAWRIIKWPVLAVLVSLMFAILYWAAPNARPSGFRWVTPGGLTAVLLWVVASLLFGIYAANFASYGETYGALGSVIVFLVWLWLTNLAILYGAELNAELERQRAVAAGHPEDEEPYVPMRDTRKVDPDADLK
jgi:membrane protein